MGKSRTPEPPVEIGISKTTTVHIGISKAKLQEIVFDWLNQGLVKDGKAPAPASKDLIEIAGRLDNEERLDGITIQYRITESL